MGEGKQGKGKWVLIGCLIPVLLVIVGVGAVAVFGYFYMKDKIVMDPAAVEKEARQVMDYKFPKGSHGLMKFGIMGVDLFMVQSKAQPLEASLVLALIPSSLTDQSEESIRASVQERMNRKMQVDQVRTEKRNLCGATVPVRIQTGKSGNPGEEPVPATSMEALVKHRGTLRMVLVMGVGPSSEKSAAAVFNTLRCP